jgi:hypothetical protein
MKPDASMAEKGVIDEFLGNHGIEIEKVMNVSSW